MDYEDNYNNNIAKETVLVFNITIGSISLFLELILGIAELTMAIIYHSQIGECYSIWELVLTSGLINILLFSIIGFDFSKILQNMNIIQINHFSMLFCNIILFIPNSWAVYIHNNISDQCRNYWIESSNELWILLLIHYYLFWSIISFISLLIVGCCGLCVMRCCDRNESKIMSI
jgi:hypothetical protein